MKIRFYIIVGVLILLSFLSVGFAAFGADLNIDNASAYVFVNMDISIIETYSYENYSNGSIINVSHTDREMHSSFSLPNIDSSVTYSVRIINNGNIDMGIFKIEGLPDNLIYSIDNYNEGVDKICDDDKPSVCNSGADKTLYLTIKYKDDSSFDVNNTIFNDVNLSFDFQFYHKVFYVGMEVDNTFPREVMNGGSLNIELPSYVTDYKITKNSIKLFDGVDYSRNGNKISLDNVDGIIRFINIVDILKDHYVNDSKSAYGITVTTTDEGFVTIDGTATNNMYVRLTDYLRIVNYRYDLYNNYQVVGEEPVVANSIISKDLGPISTKVTEISGTNNVSDLDYFKISYRRTYDGAGEINSSSLGQPDYDFYLKKVAGDGTLSADVGVISLYIRSNLVFNNYEFKVEIFDKEGNLIDIDYPVESQKLKDLEIVSKGNGIFVLNGNTSSNTFIRLNDQIIITSTRDNMYKTIKYDQIEKVETIIQSPKHLTLDGKYISGSNNLTEDNQGTLVFRRVNVEDSDRDPNIGFDFFSGAYGSGSITDDLGMATLYIVAGASFNNYCFRMRVYEEPRDYKRITYDKLEIRLYDDGRYWINGSINLDKELYVNVENDSFKFAVSLITSGDSTNKDVKYFSSNPTFIEFIPIYTRGIEFLDDSSYMKFHPLYFYKSTAIKIERPMITFNNSNSNYLSICRETDTLTKDAHAMIISLYGKINFNEFQFYLNRGDIVNN